MGLAFFAHVGSNTPNSTLNTQHSTLNTSHFTPHPRSSRWAAFFAHVVYEPALCEHGEQRTAEAAEAEKEASSAGEWRAFAEAARSLSTAQVETVAAYIARASLSGRLDISVAGSSLGAHTGEGASDGTTSSKGAREGNLAADGHHHVVCDEDLAHFLDADLAILGCPPAEYAEYARELRMEHAAHAAHPCTTDFAEVRTRLVSALLATERLFWTEEGTMRYEAAARANLSAELARLERRQ